MHTDFNPLKDHLLYVQFCIYLKLKLDKQQLSQIVICLWRENSAYRASPTGPGELCPYFEESSSSSGKILSADDCSDSVFALQIFDRLPSWEVAVASITFWHSPSPSLGRRWPVAAMRWAVASSRADLGAPPNWTVPWPIVCRRRRRGPIPATARRYWPSVSCCMIYHTSTATRFTIFASSFPVFSAKLYRRQLVSDDSCCESLASVALFVICFRRIA